MAASKIKERRSLDGQRIKLFCLVRTIYLSVRSPLTSFLFPVLYNCKFCSDLCEGREGRVVRRTLVTQHGLRLTEDTSLHPPQAGLEPDRDWWLYSGWLPEIFPIYFLMMDCPVILCKYSTPCTAIISIEKYISDGKFFVVHKKERDSFWERKLTGFNSKTFYIWFALVWFIFYRKICSIYKNTTIQLNSIFFSKKG